MRFSTHILAVVLMVLVTPMAIAGNNSEAPSINFEGSRYQLAFTNVTDNFVMNEYLLDGESLDDWSSMVAVMQFVNSDDVNDVLGPYLNRLRPLLISEARSSAPSQDPHSSDVILEAYLAPPDRSYLEYNLIRFVEEVGTDGVKAYQFAIRGEFDFDAASRANSGAITDRLLELGDLQIATSEEMDAISSEPEAEDEPDDGDDGA